MSLADPACAQGYLSPVSMDKANGWAIMIAISGGLPTGTDCKHCNGWGSMDPIGSLVRIDHEASTNAEEHHSLVANQPATR